jgi:arylsulfatase A-like enzyme
MLGYGAVSMNYSYEMIHPLNAAKYYTASIGKNHFGYMTITDPVLHGYQYHQLYDGLGNGLPNATGCCFDDYDTWFQAEMPGMNPEATGAPDMNWNSWRGATFKYDTQYHPTAWVTRQALNVIQTYNFTKAAENDEPLFLKVSYHRPHSPYDPPGEAANYTFANGDLGAITSIVHGNTWDNWYADDTHDCGAQFDSAWCGYMPPTLTNVSRVMYYANIKFIDDGIGQIVSALKALGVYEDSFILFTADHGDQLGDHNLWRKTYAYRSSANIPFMVRWPSSTDLTFDPSQVVVKRGTIEAELVVELRDLLPTFHRGIAGLSNIPSDLEGMDITCILFNEDPMKACQWREFVDLEHNICYNKTNHWNALTDGDTKYIFNAYFASEQLFDLSSDMNEMNDLAPLAPTNSSVNATLSLWRQRLVSLFENEGRGNAWVKNGVLQQRIAGETYGPNYPGYKPPYGGDLDSDL